MASAQDRAVSSRRIRWLPLSASLCCAGLLAGCDMVVLRPSGDIAAQQAQLLVISTVLMLLIIVPVIVLTLVFAWRYRASNKDAPYEPDWDHSIQLELRDLVGAAADHHRPGRADLDRHAHARSLPPAATHRAAAPATSNPLDVQVVALDWKWLFIYPEQGIAMVNELAAPVDVPIRFKITSSSVMNSFYIPALAGQIYAMPGMETKLHAVINQPGRVRGLLGQLQRRRLLRHALQVPRPERRRLRALGAEGQGGRPGAEPRRLPAARTAQRARAGAPLRQRSRPACTTPSSIAASTAAARAMQRMMAASTRGGARRQPRRRRDRAALELAARCADLHRRRIAPRRSPRRCAVTERK